MSSIDPIRVEAPPYGVATLAEVLPSVAASLGVPLHDADGGLVEAPFPLPPAARAVVVLVDGLGDRLLRSRSGHAPYLRTLLDGGRSLTAGFPSTTATSLASFGTGRPPGSHGLVGYEVLDPARGVLFNELQWDPQVEPLEWQPHATVFQRAELAGVPVTRVGPGFTGGSGLTQSALRGGGFVAAESLDERVTATVAAVRATPRALVYVYYADVDKVGHVSGCQSWEWGEELGRVDDAVRRLAESLPSDTALYVTADHGMVDVAMDHRIDLAHDRELSAGVWLSGGEPRAPHLYCEPGAAPDVLAAWRERLGDLAWVQSREEAVAAGWFGPVEPRVLPRLGDVVVATRGEVAVVDSRHQRPQLLALIGLHGSLTPDETAVPLLSVFGSAVG